MSSSPEKNYQQLIISSFIRQKTLLDRGMIEANAIGIAGLRSMYFVSLQVTKKEFVVCCVIQTCLLCLKLTNFDKALNKFLKSCFSCCQR